MNRQISFLGIKVNGLNKKEMVDTLLEFSEGDRPRTAFYLNAHCANIACGDREYRSILNSADLVYAGGQGVVTAAGFLGTPLPERVNILDFFGMLIERLKEKGSTLYLLGAEQAVVKDAEKALAEKGLKVVGSRNGFFENKEENDIIRKINVLKPDILLVGLGAPKQEKWIYRHRDELDVKLCWGVGAAFEWLSGHRERAPEWMINRGLEWLHRLYQQPLRLGKRYLIGNTVFIYRVLEWKIKEEFNNKAD
jgi:N-acetylglucosaminyldiphosphoundecaprenol N-acetyl-beta-D-mannosaminyltransferase